MARYLDVKKGILEKLRTREWLPGTRLPPENRLAAEFSVSVGTLRHAVGELCEEGILWRRQGAGTFVRSYRDGGAGYWNRFQPFQTRDGRPLVLVDRDVQLLEIVPADESIARKLRLAEGTSVIHVLRRMVVKGTGHIGSDELFLHPDYFPGLTRERFEKNLEPDESLYSFYEREFGVEIVETSNFVAWNLGDHELAERLQMGALEGMPLVFYNRISKTYAHQPVEIRVIRVRADTVQISLDITR